MDNPTLGAGPCILLTATIKVKADLVFTERRDANTRFDDYQKALVSWLEHPDVRSIVMVENSGYDLSPLRAIAQQSPDKQVEFLSFEAPPFSGQLGKGYGEMLCLEYALQHSRLIAAADRVVKVTGRYFLVNANEFFALLQSTDADVVCDMLLNLSWADSRVFAAQKDFLRRYLLPMRDAVNDSASVNFEHVLARAAHACMADGGTWAEPPFPLEIRGVSGSQDRNWKLSFVDKLKLRARHKLMVRFLASGPR